MSRTRIAILGLGPAAVAAALRLQQIGFAPLVVGVPRRESAFEGVSGRVVEGFRRLGCRLDAALGPALTRVSCWNGRRSALNREAVVDRRDFDAVLLGCLEQRRVATHLARVARIRQEDTGWRIELGEGDLQGAVDADFVLDARGASAPRQGDDLLAGATSIALSGEFAAAATGQAMTITESFRDGWAWCVLQADGRARVQIVVDAAQPGLGPDLAALHSRCMADLREIPQALGSGARAVGSVTARGIRPGLRAGIAGPGHLRIGDAAASHDPLSGHGMFEAVSSAFAAAPVVNTLLRRPDAASAAQDFYLQRCRARCAHNLELGATLYRSETRWPSAPFWARRAGRAGAPAATAARWQRQAVIEDGFVVEREVVIAAEHASGVRFVAGVELAALRRAIDRHPAGDIEPDLAALAEALGTDPQSVGHARDWLAKRRLLTNRG